MNKKEKRILKKIFKEQESKPVQSLTEEPRYFSKDDEYEYFSEYGFLGYDLTDEEIHEIVYDMVLTINSPYDCTGKPFTCWITAHKNPSGLVSYVHRIGLDV